MDASSSGAAILAQAARPNSLAVLERPAQLLVVVPRLVIGGTERHLLAVLPRLDRDRFAVELATTRGPGRLDENIRQAGVPVANAPLPLPGRAALPAALGRLLLRFLRRPPDIAHFFLPEAYLAGGLAAHLAPSCKTVMSRRSLNRYQLKHPLLARVERRLHGSMDAVSANSEAAIAELREEGVPADRLQLIRNGIDLDRFGKTPREKARRDLDLESDALVIVMLATLLPYKGHDVVLRALASVAPDLPEGWRLLLAGRDEGIGEALREQAGALGLTEQVRFIGELSPEQVPAFLAAGDIGLLASREESAPNAAVEGMAAGLAMLVSDVGGAGEVVESGVSGCVVPPEQPDALGRALLGLSRDPDMRARLAAAGSARARRLFSIERCVADYEALYDRVLHGRTPIGGREASL